MVHELLVIVVDTAAPVVPSSVLHDQAGLMFGELVRMFGRLWPAFVPFIGLRLGFGLLEWWLDARKRRSQPEQLTLF